MAGGFGDGARLMRSSFDVLRQDPALLWFPVLSTLCLLLTAGFWIFEGAWLVAVSGPALMFVPLVLVGLYSLVFVGVFFNVALAGCADDALAGREISLGDGLDVAWSCLGPIAGWAAYSLFVSFALGLVQSIRGARLLGRAAQVAWSFATLFVVPLIALDGLDAGDARRQSFDLARSDWQRESGGLVALRVVLFIPGILFYAVVNLLQHGHDHTLSGQLLLGVVLLAAFGLNAAVGVVRQIFAVSLYRRTEPESAAQIA
jgi:uncharacterized protein DUF6159